MRDKPGFVAELKRRNVLRAAALYVGAAWALSQGISQLSGPLALPSWVTVWFLIACAIGFPLWLAFAWFYEFTPHGFRRDEDIAQDAPLRQSNARRLNFGIIAVLAVAAVLLASGYFIRRHARVPTDAAVAGAAHAPFAPPVDTLVVLPFQNLGNEPNQQYFSDGITEELTNALGQNTALRVIAWNTASRFRGSTETPAAIGRVLDVANILHGSVEREGDRVRVMAELVDARSGEQRWSNHYDAALTNVFAVQDQITAAIADALKVKFAGLGPPRAVNPEAHDLALRAWELIEKANTVPPYEQARKLLERAVALAPDYADAHAALARTWFDLTQLSTLPLDKALRNVRKEANLALAIDAHNVEALVVLGDAAAAEGKIAEARSLFRRALAINPSNADAHTEYSNVVPLRESTAQTLEAVRLDPDSADAQYDLAQNYLDGGAYRKALAPAQAMMRLDPTSADNAFGLAFTYSLLRRNADAIAAFDRARPRTELAKALIAAGKLTYHAVLDPELRAKALAAVDALHQRTDLDPTSMADVIQLYLALGHTAAALGMLPSFCAATPVGCSDLSLNPEWLPLRADPRFRKLVRKYDTASVPMASAPAAPATS